MRRSLPHLPARAISIVESMLEPETLTIIAGTLIVWAGSHFFGIGEIVDAILLSVGVLTIGFAVFEGANELSDFVKGSIEAKSEANLEQAAQHFARAVTVLGIAVVQGFLLRGQGRILLKRGIPRIKTRSYVGAPPPPGNQLWLSRPARIPGSLGGSDAYGVIKIARNQSLTEQRITLFHELVHRYF